MCSKRNAFDQCMFPVLINGQMEKKTLSLTSKVINRIKVTQRAKKRSMLNTSLRDRIPNNIIREKS